MPDSPDKNLDFQDHAFDTQPLKGYVLEERNVSCNEELNQSAGDSRS